MVNNVVVAESALVRIKALAAIYVILVVATIVALGVLEAVHSDEATSDAWGHALIVLVFAVVLPLRLRAAARGSNGAWRAVGIVAAVLLVVNVVESSLPGLFPVWMRLEMVVTAVLMLGVVVLVFRGRR